MIAVIVNPIAGAGLAKTIGEKVEAELTRRNIDHQLLFTAFPGHATQLAKEAAAQGATTVMSVGGDGTLSETAAGLVHTQTALGIIPAGTGNDFIKVIHTPAKWLEALDFILKTPARPVDTGMMNERFFLNVCGAGFDVMVLDYALIAKKRVQGIWPYLYGVIRSIRNFKPFEMHVTIGDDKDLNAKLMLCTIANGRFIGGGIPIMPASEVDDGLLDILTVDAVPAWKIPFYLPALMTGKLMNKKIAHHYRATKCSLSSPHMRLNLDGEIFPIEETRFECMPASLLVHW